MIESRTTICNKHFERVVLEERADWLERDETPKSTILKDRSANYEITISVD